MNLEIEYPRRKTREVAVGNAIIGGDNPIIVQSMIVDDTRDVEKAICGIIKLYDAGCEIVRVTVPTRRDATALAEIKAELTRRGIHVPIVADIHHQGTAIALECAKHVDKLRINPGLFIFKKPKGTEEYSEAEHKQARIEIFDQLRPVLEICKRRDIAMRIGVNHGSLSDRMTVTYGDTPDGLVESALEFVRICEKNEYRNLVISLKASRVPIFLQANRLMAQRMYEEGMDYPIHLGVTEAGDGQYARIKSTSGIATLLSEGLGDTIRVSLSEDPLNEIPVCYEILQALGLRKTIVEFIACPGCGRTKFDLPTVLNQIKQATGHLVGLDIAVMGCIVNGPGEMADADYGYVGKAGGMIALYRGKEMVNGSVPQNRGVKELVSLIKTDGRWVEPFSA